MPADDLGQQSQQATRSSYLHNGTSYTGKMSSLYWIGAQDFCINAFTTEQRHAINIFIRHPNLDQSYVCMWTAGPIMQ